MPSNPASHNTKTNPNHPIILDDNHYTHSIFFARLRDTDVFIRIYKDSGTKTWCAHMRLLGLDDSNGLPPEVYQDSESAREEALWGLLDGSRRYLVMLCKQSEGDCYAQEVEVMGGLPELIEAIAAQPWAEVHGVDTCVAQA